MKFKFGDLIKTTIPLSKKKKAALDNLESFFNKSNFQQIEKLLKLDKIKIIYESYNTSHNFLSFSNYPQIKSLSEDKEIKDFIKEANQTIKDLIKDDAYKRFSKNAHEKLISLIAPGINGLKTIKKACMLQLFTDEQFHILLLGDPGTGKTDIIRSASQLHKISSFGLGSGTSGVGLSVTFKGNDMIKGLLPSAHEGICAIDELNLLKQEDRASLYSAMEKGFITYDKSNKHITIDAKINVLATANPKGDKFVGFIIDTLKKQLPFDSALLTRFHLTFLLRKPDIKEFLEITKQILKGDKKESFEQNQNFAKEYIEYAKSIEVKIPSKLEQQITHIVEEIKENEDKYLVEISPRIVIGFMRLVKARARINLRDEVSSDDIKDIKEIYLESLQVTKKNNPNKAQSD